MWLNIDSCGLDWNVHCAFCMEIAKRFAKKDRGILIRNLEKKTSAIRHEKINHVKNLFLFIDGIGKELDCQILTLFAVCPCSTVKTTFLKEKIAAQSVASIQPVLFCVAVSGQIY